MSDNIVYINKLNRLGSGFKYSNEIETKIANLIGSYYPKFIFSNLTVGLNSDYDYQLSGYKVEQKISGLFAFTESNKFKIAIEYERGDGRKSGIFTTKSDVYLCLNPGYNSTYGVVGKLRLFPTNEVVQQTNKAITQRNIIYFGTKGRNSGASHAILNPRDLNQLWLGDLKCEIDSVKNKVVGYHFDKFLDYNNKLEKRLLFMQDVILEQLYVGGNDV